MRRWRTAARSADQLADILTAAAGDGRPSWSAAGSWTRPGWPLAFWSRNAALGGCRIVNGGRLSEPGPPFWVHSTLRSRGDRCPHRLV